MMDFIFYLNGLKWTVRLVDKDSEMLMVDDEFHYGTCHYVDLIIYLWDGCNLLMKKVLMHELAHACIECYGMLGNEVFSHEQLCEFTAFYSERILQIADDFMEAMNYAKTEGGVKH